MSNYFGDRISVDDKVYWRGYPNRSEGKVNSIIEDHKTGQTICEVEWSDTKKVELVLASELTLLSDEERGFMKPKDNKEDLANKEKYDKEIMKNVDAWKSPKKKEPRGLWANLKLAELSEEQVNYVKLLMAVKGKNISDDAKFYDGGNGIALIANKERETVVKFANGQVDEISYFINGEKVNEYQHNTYKEEQENKVVIRANKDNTYYIKWGETETEQEEEYVSQFVESQGIEWDSVKTELDEKGEVTLGGK